jgi:hypothetical protein
MDIRPQAMKVTVQDVKDTVMGLAQWSQANGCMRAACRCSAGGAISHSRCRYMFTVANARDISEREVEQALNALHVAHGDEPPYCHD